MSQVCIKTRINIFMQNTLIHWVAVALFCVPRQIKLNNLHFNCASSLIVVTTNHNVFRHKSLRIICGWIYAGYSPRDTLWYFVQQVCKLSVSWVMRVTPDLLHSQIVTSCLLHSHHSQVLTSSIDMLILSFSKLDSCFFLLNFHEQESWRHSRKA